MTRWLMPIGIGLLIAAIIAVVVVRSGEWQNDTAMAAEVEDGSVLADRVLHGRYVAVLADCEACHTQEGGGYMAGGKPLETPFGTLVPPNITPDPTGIGAWSEADFRRMMKTGIGHGGERIYPAMPYPAYTNMTDTDIADLWTYLTTLEPVANHVEANRLPFPLNVRLSLAGWNLLNFRRSPWRPDPGASAEVNRGSYLVNGPGHCGTCHSPKTLLGADKSARNLQGALLQGWYAPNLTGDRRTGLGGWTRADIVTYLHDGVNRHAIASGPMAEAIQASTSAMTEADLQSIASYLKTLPAAGLDGAAATPSPSRMAAGGAVYRLNCSACHGQDGTGQSPLIPTLAGSAIVQQPNVGSLVHVVVAGAQAVHTAGRPTAPAMPSLGWRLDDREIADVLTFIRNSWGNRAAEVRPGEVKRK